MTDQKKTGRQRKSISENAWVKYQDKKIKAKFGSLKNRLTGEKRNKKSKVPIVSVLVVLVAMCGLLFTFLEYHKSDRIYEKAEEKYVTLQDRSEIAQGKADSTDRHNNESIDGIGAGIGNTGAGSVIDNSVNSTETQKEWYELASVDLETLQATYPDVAGWLYFENESISYPVMYSGDNEKYLRTAYTGKAANAGAIFLDGEGSGDFSDPHTLIYGHNMKNLSMFGRLRYYRTEKGYYDGHKYFQIFTGSYIYRYEIFAYGQIPADGSVYYVYGAEPDAESFKSLIKDLKKISMQDTGVEVGPSDHVITLSTCTGDGDVRMIVSAVRVDEHRR